MNGAEALSSQFLDFHLPDFVRVSWVSDQAREIWRPRLQRVAACWHALEVLTVAENLRPCCSVCVSANDLMSHAARWLAMGLSSLPFASVRGAVGRSVDRTGAAPEERSYYRVAIGRPADVLSFKDAYDAFDDLRMGRLLGYPVCCTEFLRRHAFDVGSRDPVWLMAAASGADAPAQRTATVDSLPGCNQLWRWLNVRSVPHLPCSFACQSTQGLMDQIVEVAQASGYRDEMRWLAEVLAWPVEWSALHGIAEVKTPILKLCTNTDATAVKFTVRLNGTRYPAEGARGVHFPYRVTDPGACNLVNST